MPVNFREIFNSLKRGVSNLAETSLKDFVKQAKSDGEKILETMKINLKKWTIQLADKEITPDDFKFLVLGQKDLLEMVALKQAGLAMVQIDRFRNGVLNLIIDTVINAVL